MPKKKYAIKGEPDFHNLSDARVKDYLDLTQQLIFCYQGVDDSKVQVLKSIWKDLSDESIDRRCNSPEVPATPMMRKVPKIRRSPATKR